MPNLREVLTQEEKDKFGHLLMDVDTNIKLSSVILSEENQEKINQFRVEMENAEKLHKYGLEPMNRLLFYGASGTGKTYLAKALSNELNRYMLYVDIAKALSDGSVSTSISSTFYLANKYKKCIIFYDECDSIAWNRDAAAGEGGVARRATNSIFQSLDQMDPTCVFISATNMLHRLDAAFENRFNLKLEFRRPELTIEKTLHRFLNDGFTVNDDIDSDAKYIIDKRCRLSYRELRSICERAMKRAVIDDTFCIKLSDVYKDVASVQRFKIDIAHSDEDGEGMDGT